jgi:hypothetical protein
MDQCKFKLTPALDQVKITGRYYNRASHAMAWTGIFEAEKPVLASEGQVQIQAADVILRIEKLSKEKSVEVKLVIDPGASHFVEISASSSGIKGSPVKSLENTQLEIRSRNRLATFSKTQ